MSSVTVEDMGVDSLKFTALHSKTAWRSFLVSSFTTSLTLITPPVSRTSSVGRTSSFTSHWTWGLGRPGRDRQEHGRVNIILAFDSYKFSSPVILYEVGICLSWSFLNWMIINLIPYYFALVSLPICIPKYKLPVKRESVLSLESSAGRFW